jgi:predicted anti-sigma-YlaC factor YlaD
MNAHDDKHADTFQRLLGPTGYEVGCDDCFEFLDEFVELELGGVDAEARIPGLPAHLQGCPACREEHDALYELVAGENRRS